MATATKHSRRYRARRHDDEIVLECRRLAELNLSGETIDAVGRRRLDWHRSRHLDWRRKNDFHQFRCQPINYNDKCNGSAYFAL
jgi:hypothetical protein